MTVEPNKNSSPTRPMGPTSQERAQEAREQAIRRARAELPALRRRTDDAAARLRRLAQRAAG